MPHLRLMGLVLFITTVFLAMAAAITQTIAIQVRNPMYSPSESSGEVGINADSEQSTGEVERGEVDEDPDESEGEFITVPIVFPLLIAAIVGLMMWFVPAGLTPQPTKRKRRSRKRKR